MKGSTFWKWLAKKQRFLLEGGLFGAKMKQLPLVGIICTLMLFMIYRTSYYQYQATKMESDVLFHPLKDGIVSTSSFSSLPRGIVEASSDLELKPLWIASAPNSEESNSSRYLLAMPVGVKQKKNVDTIVKKFLPENFTVILFHYDKNLDGWWDLEWSREAVHVIAHNQTKWWFAKRFLHPDVVSMYEYIFLWDEDLGVENFHPGRYLDIIKSEGFEISQPALDPNSTDIHHRITVRKKTQLFHRQVYDTRGTTKCVEDSEGPPCTGFVEGMAPVFSRSAWRCAWLLIQNDLVHGWGMDMKLGYCAQGDRTRNVGIVDSEYIIHQGIQTLGGSSVKKAEYNRGRIQEDSLRRRGNDVRVEIRRQSMYELKTFKKRWDRAVEDDKRWVDPFSSRKLKRKRRRSYSKV